MRLFVAVDLPHPVAELVAALPRPERAGLRWTSPAQWHVTLKFLGEAEPDQAILAAGSAPEWLDDAPVVASVGPESAWFPGRRVLQVPVAGLDPLATALRRVTQAWGSDDDHPFRGHLTLARTAGRRRGPADVAGAPLSARFPVTEFGVYSSVTGRGGPVYERLASFPLAASSR